MAMPPVSIEKYLDMSFEYDCEWVSGEIIERNGGEFEHSFLLSLLGAHFFNHHAEWNILPLISVRTRTAPTRIRVPELTRSGGAFRGIGPRLRLGLLRFLLDSNRKDSVQALKCGMRLVAGRT